MNTVRLKAGYFQCGTPVISCGDAEVAIYNSDAWRRHEGYTGRAPLTAMIHVCPGAWGSLDRLFKVAHAARRAGKLSRIEYITARALIGRAVRRQVFRDDNRPLLTETTPSRKVGT